jgi:ubiquinone/menaquinone biosynthesis C-methylase UbiE
MAWIPPAAFADLKRLDAAILNKKDAPPLRTLDSRLEDLIADNDGPGGRTQDFLRAALLVTARRVSVAQDSKNPTWLKRGNGLPSGAMDVFEEFRTIVKAMAADIKAAFHKQPDTRHVAILEADARKLPLPDRSIDAIVTSPPYLTRIDYAVGTAPELVFLGYESEEDFRTLRRSIMGSTCVTGGPYGARTCWGKTCLEALDQVQRHPAKASSGYYLKMHLQYFQDAEAILRECLRVLKPGAPAVFVVQDSWYKDVHIALGRIYVEMARTLGATHAETIHTEAVRNPIALLNTRARRYQKGALHEHVVLFRR